MREIQNNLLNRCQGLLQGALTTLNTININKLTQVPAPALPRVHIGE